MMHFDELSLTIGNRQSVQEAVLSPSAEDTSMLTNASQATVFFRLWNRTAAREYDATTIGFKSTLLGNTREFGLPRDPAMARFFDFCMKLLRRSQSAADRPVLPPTPCLLTQFDRTQEAIIEQGSTSRPSQHARPIVELNHVSGPSYRPAFVQRGNVNDCMRFTVSNDPAAAGSDDKRPSTTPTTPTTPLPTTATMATQRTQVMPALQITEKPTARGVARAVTADKDATLLSRKRRPIPSSTPATSP
ncbi:hypothetical protein BKA62DRAFT_676793 [Auriculariales sp. MPI-PUGE-AT-0066]|nr:hypothetical protein BKA62DRAFT_676793 [Auriculariales sp. MPI-PUGE-AT-0066]